MHLDITAEVLLLQLNYSKSENSLAQAQRVIDSTKGFEKISKHIIALHDKIKKMNAYVSLSNTNDCLKIKCEQNDVPEILAEFHNEINQWSKKYSVKVEQIEERPVYYIQGLDK